MMSKEKRRVPKLRFPGFTEDWEQRKLIDIAKTFIGLVTTMTENYRDSGTLLIRNSDIKEGQFLFSENPIHLDEEFAEKNKTRRLQIGDVVTVHTGDIGTSAVIEEKEAGAIGFATINTRTDKSILNPYFLATYFNTEKHKCYANSVSTGDGRSNYNIKDFNKLVISVPTLDEQERISVLINDINIIITLHQRKLDNLKLKKKALLQKLFPKNGERYPELRFPEFTDAWEQREFSDIFAEVKSGLSRMLSNDDIGLPVVRANNINDGQLNLVDDIKYWYKNDPQGANTNNYLIEQGDILINFINSEAKMGTAAYVTRRPERDTIYTTNILRCKVNDEYNPYFIYSLTFLNSYKNYIASITKPAVNQASFTTVDFKKYSIKIPTVKEQNQIADLIETFNKLITLHQRKLDHLQLQKKALLQQMFV